MSSRGREILVLVLLGVVLLTHVWVACWIHPYADDLSYAITAYDQPLWERLVREHQGWNGRWSSNVLVLRGPLVLGLDRGLGLYRLVPPVLMALVLAATVFLLGRLFGGVLSARQRWIASLGFLLAYLHLMPHAGEGLYWYTGAVTYLLPNVVLLMVMAVHLAAADSRGVPRVLWSLLALLFTAFVSGANETAMVTLVVLHASAWWMLRRTRHALPLLIGTCVALAGGLFMVSAPGNAWRASLFSGTHDPLRTVVWGGAYSARFFLRMCASPVFWASCIAVVVWARRTDQHWPRGPLNADPRWVTGLAVLVAFLAMALPVWSTGILGQLRTSNAALFVVLPLCWWAAVLWDRRILRPRCVRIPVVDHPAMPALIAGIALLALIFLGQGGRIMDDLWQGRLQRYDAQCRARYAAVAAAVRDGRDELVLEPLHDPPASLGVIDLSRDPGHWTNATWAVFAGAERLPVRVE